MQRRRSRWERPHRAAVLLVVALFASRCSTCPQDGDGQPAGANLLPLNTRHSDSLDCGSDCADWYYVTPGESGTLEVVVSALRTAAGTPPGFRVEIHDAGQSLLDRRMGDARSSARARARVRPGRYYASVHLEKSSAPLSYEIRARMLRAQAAPEPPAPRPPPPPSYHTVSARVVEVEGRSGQGQTVVLDQGRAAGLRKDQPGRLVERGRSIADIKITDVYEKGARAKILGELKGVVSAETTAEIRVPVGGR